MSKSNFKRLVAIGLPSNLAESLSDNGYSITKLRALSKSDLENVLGGLQYIENIYNKKRSPIPIDVISSIIHKCAKVCCVCKERKPSFIIHHIVPYSKTRDNSEGNLVLLCLDDHDQAHSKKELSKNLTPEMLRDLKSKWEKLVHDRNIFQIVSEEKDENSFRISWDYINVKYLEDFSEGLTVLGELPYFNQLVDSNVILENGRLNLGNDSGLGDLDSVDFLYGYNKFPFNPLLTFHKELLKLLVKKKELRFIDVLSGDTNFEPKNGQIVLLKASYLFKKNNFKNKNIVSVSANVGDIKLSFEIDAFYFTSHSAGGHMSKRAKCVGLLLIRDFDGRKSLKASAVAMGIRYFDL